MLKKINNKKVIIIAMVCLIVLQCVVYVAAAKNKQYLHMDESYSLGLSQYHGVEIQDNHDFYGNWHAPEYYKDYLSVNKDELNNFKQVYENQKNDVHPPMYYFLLRFYMEFSTDEIPIMAGIILNIMIYACITLVLYFIVKRLFVGDEYGNLKAFLLTAISSLTLSTVSSVIYIRMYALLTLQVLLILMIHIKLYEAKSMKLYFALLLFLVSAAGVLTHYYFIFFLLPLYILFLVRYLRKKEFKNAIAYSVSFAIAAVTVIAIFPYCINHMFFGYRGQGVMDNLLNIKQFFINIGQFIYHINNYAFNYTFYIVAAAIVLLSVVLVIKHIIAKNKNKENTFKINDIGAVNTIIIPTVVYFFIAAIASPFTELRYMYPICQLLLIIALWALGYMCKKAFGKISAYLVLAFVLICMITLPVRFNAEPQVTYSNKKYAVEYAESHKDIPVLYAFTTQNDRFLDDIYLFTIFEQSYITRDWYINSENMTNVFRDIDTSKGVIVIINVPQNDEEILECIKDTLNLSSFKHVEGLNSANIYYIEK